MPNTENGRDINKTHQIHFGIFIKYLYDIDSLILSTDATSIPFIKVDFRVSYIVISSQLALNNPPTLIFLLLFLCSVICYEGLQKIQALKTNGILCSQHMGLSGRRSSNHLHTRNLFHIMLFLIRFVKSSLKVKK